MVFEGSAASGVAQLEEVISFTTRHLMTKMWIMCELVWMHVRGRRHQAPPSWRR